jgi:hypothetical protein
MDIQYYKFEDSNVTKWYYIFQTNFFIYVSKLKKKLNLKVDIINFMIFLYLTDILNLLKRMMRKIRMMAYEYNIEM